MYEQQCNEILAVQRQIQHLHPILTHLYPVAVAQDEYFLIHDLTGNGGYSLVKEVPVPMPIPSGVRAAFPLDSYDDRIVCVVTADVFDALEGYAVIFHEFVHCYQYENDEMALKAQLTIANAAAQNQDSFWELTYPFPYADAGFEQVYDALYHALTGGNRDAIQRLRGELQHSISAADFEYLVWQEWKEGLARLIENRIRQQLNLPLNGTALQPPFDRVSFYTGGAAMIDFLAANQPELMLDLSLLFDRLKGTGG